MMRGTAFRTVIAGSRISPTSGSNAAPTPRNAPTTTPSARPSSAAPNVASICIQISPSAKSAIKVAATLLGGGM